MKNLGQSVGNTTNTEQLLDNQRRLDGRDAPGGYEQDVRMPRSPFSFCDKGLRHDGLGEAL
jgi:hypothetical protein